MPYPLASGYRVSETTRAWAYNGSLYVAGTTASTGANIVVFRSTNMGRSWGIADSGNSPANDVSTSVQTWLNGSILYVVKRNNAADVTIQRFDCAANAWTTAVSGTAVTADGGTTDVGKLFVVGASAIAYFYRGNSASRDLKVAIWNGSSWSNTTISTDAAGGLMSTADGVVDSSGYISFFYRDGNGADAGLTAVTISPALAIGAEQLLNANAIFPQGGYLGLENDGTEYTLLPFSDASDTGAYLIRLGAATPLTVETTYTVKTSKQMYKTSGFTFNGTHYVIGTDNTSGVGLYQYKYNGSTWDETFLYPKSSSAPYPTPPFEVLGGVGCIYTNVSSTAHFGWIVPPRGFGNTARNFQLRPVSQ